MLSLNEETYHRNDEPNKPHIQKQLLQNNEEKESKKERGELTNGMMNRPSNDTDKNEPPSGATDSKDSASSSRNLSFFPADFVPGKYVIVTMSTYPSLRAIEIKTSIYLCRLIAEYVHGISNLTFFCPLLFLYRTFILFQLGCNLPKRKRTF